MKLFIKNRYGQTPVSLLNSKKISLKAKGLFGYLQAKPDGWSFSIDRMSGELIEGKEAIRSAIKELEENQYLLRKPTKDENGKWDGYDYFLYEGAITDDGLTVDGKSDDGKSDDGGAGHHYIDIERNKDININNKDINNTIDHFSIFRELYPKKISKQKAKQSYEKAIKQGVSQERIIIGIKKYLEHIKKNKIEDNFIKHPTTRLNGGCRDDVYELKKEGKSKRELYQEYEKKKMEEECKKGIEERKKNADDFISKLDKEIINDVFNL